MRKFGDNTYRNTKINEFSITNRFWVSCLLIFFSCLVIKDMSRLQLFIIDLVKLFVFLKTFRAYPTQWRAFFFCSCGVYNIYNRWKSCFFHWMICLKNSWNYYPRHVQVQNLQRCSIVLSYSTHQFENLIPYLLIFTLSVFFGGIFVLFLSHFLPWIILLRSIRP